MHTTQVSLPEINAAAERIRPYVLATPLLSGDALGSDGLWLKAENLQRTGSFKVRGAFNAVIQLGDKHRAHGVITLSAGNFGQALAFAARRFGIPCVVVIREDAQKTKLEAIQRFGAEIVLVPVGEWQQRLEEEQARRGLHLVHPFDDPAVVNGQGTVGLEILAALPAVRTVVVPIGGGGLIAGVAVAIKNSRPGVRIVGVEPEGANAVSRSLAAGHPVALERIDTVAVLEPDLFRRECDAARDDEADFSLAEQCKASDGVRARVVGVNNVGAPLARDRPQLPRGANVPFSAQR